MPAYNEDENIEKVVESWYPILSLEGVSNESKIVIADSGSKDRTHEILVRLKNNKYPRLDILHTDNQYHGPKVIALYDYAINNNADYIFQTDSDGQTNPNEFDIFWKNRDKYSGIFGNRTVRGDGKDRAFVEKIVCLLLNIYFGVKVPDANAPFRLMKTDCVKKYLYRLDSDYNLPNIMITTYFSFYKENIKFIEISFKSRTAGKNSINFKKIFHIGWKALGDFHNFKKDMKK